ncbi:acyl-CoA thioesterase [Bdellovibrio sp. HCB337]|uniref:acyl-CoA thioesterase n=1 Tax=Bdellovibrio sp. HCB337 TaxID=3394358 RepID=UPI0039A62C88
MSVKFKTQTRIKFRDADPAQIMYFANVFSLAHDAFEEFIVSAGYRYAEWFSKNDHLIPIRHAEADFKAPFVPGQTYDVTAVVASLGTTSFKMKYDFTQNDRLHSTVYMVHTVLDPKTQQKMALPEVMKKRLTPYVEENHGN